MKYIKGLEFMLIRIVKKIVRILYKRKNFKRADHKKIFERIYNEKVWGETISDNPFYSGTGSDEVYANIYSTVISQFIIDNQIKSMVDLGCGDFRVGQKILEKVNIEYTGLDIVPDLINYNNINFSRHNINFKCLNIVNDDLLSAELCTVRQVFQHLSNNDIKKVLRKCKQYKYLIVTEHLPISESPFPNLDKPSDETIRLMFNSGVYLDKHPFSVNIKELLTVYPEVEKDSKIVTYLVF
jgi:SAM-dependent methyltransferase